jgi:hypothetical protein
MGKQVVISVGIDMDLSSHKERHISLWVGRGGVAFLGV